MSIKYIWQDKQNTQIYFLRATFKICFISGDKHIFQTLMIFNQCDNLGISSLFHDQADQNDYLAMQTPLNANWYLG